MLYLVSGLLIGAAIMHLLARRATDVLVDIFGESVSRLLEAYKKADPHTADMFIDEELERLDVAFKKWKRNPWRRPSKNY